MMVRRIARWSIIVTTMLFAVSAAVAQTGNPAPGPGGGGKLRAACGQDARRFLCRRATRRGPHRSMSIVPQS